MKNGRRMVHTLFEQICHVRSERLICIRARLHTPYCAIPYLTVNPHNPAKPAFCLQLSELGRWQSPELLTQAIQNWHQIFRSPNLRFRHQYRIVLCPISSWLRTTLLALQPLLPILCIHLAKHLLRILRVPAIPLWPAPHVVHPRLPRPRRIHLRRAARVVRLVHARVAAGWPGVHHGGVVHARVSSLPWSSSLRRRHPLCLARHGAACSCRARLVSAALLARHDVDEEVEHVALGERGRDVGALQRAPLVVFGVDPGAHGQLRDEDVAALGEQDGRFGGDHFDFGVGFHDLFDAGEGKLVDLEVVDVGFEVRYCLLPVGGEDVAGGTGEALVDLRASSHVSEGR